MITIHQQQALLRLYRRFEISGSFLSFRRQAVKLSFGDCVMIRCGSMFIGIERDGYTHS